MIIYELTPVNNQKSFYGKAFVIEENNQKTLYSYNTKILTIDNITGEAVRFWDSWSNTTGKHIFAFCCMHKKEYFNVKLA